MKVSLEACRELDRADPLAKFRQEFDLPPGVIYLDGNSLGPPLKATGPHVDNIIRGEWGTHLIGAWNRSWWEAPERLGGLLAPLIGAQPNEVIVTDTISLNLFKLIAYALRLSGGRRVILSDGANFPTDRYVAEGMTTLVHGLEHRTLPAAGCLDPAASFDETVAVAVLSHIDYRTGRMHDMAEITRRADALGIHLIWDLAHSAGALPVALNKSGVSLALGCTYKYLNGGPGAPAFIYVREDLQGRAVQPLTGWFGHAEPFAFESYYRPSQTIRQFLTGTHSALALGALEASLKLWQSVDMDALREKSLSLTRLFIMLTQPLADEGLTLVTPVEPQRRGSQVSFTRESGGYAIIQALAERGVIGDYRAPGLLRFGFAPLYLSHEDVWIAAHHLAAVIKSGEYLADRFQPIATVT